MNNIFELDIEATGCMSTKEVWVGKKEDFWSRYTYAGNGYDIDYGAPIPSFEIEDPAALLEFIKLQRWAEFASIMLCEYGIHIMESPLIPILKRNWCCKLYTGF